MGKIDIGILKCKTKCYLAILVCSDSCWFGVLTSVYMMWGHLNSRLVPVLVTLMGDVFPELKGNKERIRDIIKEEEEAFGKTLLKVHI